MNEAVLVSWIQEVMVYLTSFSVECNINRLGLSGTLGLLSPCSCQINLGPETFPIPSYPGISSHLGLCRGWSTVVGAAHQWVAVSSLGLTSRGVPVWMYELPKSQFFPSSVPMGPSTCKCLSCPRRRRRGPNRNARSTPVLFLCSPNMAALYRPSTGQADKTSKSLPVTGFLSNLRGVALFSANHCSFLIPVPQARAKGGRFLGRQAMAFFLWPQAESSMGEFGFFFSLFFIFIPKFQQHQLPFIQC